MTDNANAFFRAGEHRALLGWGRLPEAAHRARRTPRASQIESWGRGIQRIFEACRQGGAPEPEIRLSGHDLWTEFPYSPEYLEAIGEKGGKTSVETTVETSDQILQAFKLNREMTLIEVAESIGKSKRAVERASAKLVEAGKLRHVGPAKGGHWEVLK